MLEHCGGYSTEADPDFANLKEHLNTMTADEVIKELDAALDAAELSGKEIDLNVLHLYDDALSEKTAPKEDGLPVRDFWEKFQYDHPTLFKQPDNVKPMYRMSLHHTRLFQRLIIAAVVAAVVIGGALANRYMTRVTDHGETMRVSSPSGNMVREDDDLKGYASLEAALKDKGISASGIAITWIPADYHFESANAVDTEDGVKITAIYRDADGDGKIVFRLTQIKKSKTSIDYEKNDDYSRTIYSQEMPYYLMRNNKDTRILWDVGNLHCNIYGDVTEEILEEMVKSIIVR